MSGLLWVIHHPSPSRALIQNREPSRKAGVELAKDSCWSLVPGELEPQGPGGAGQSFVCFTHSLGAQSQAPVAFHGKGQLANILALQTIWSWLQLLRFAVMVRSSWGFT